MKEPTPGPLPGTIAQHDQDYAESEHVAGMVHAFAQKLRDQGEPEEFVQSLTSQYLADMILEDE